MHYRVVLSEDAERDIEDIWRYIARHDSAEKADYVLRSIEKAVLGLSNMSERGNIPKELVAIGIKDYREVHFKPYRMIYRRIGEDVIVYCVVDGRRDMRSFLERRLLR